jgi:hypothetical protein
MTFASSCDPQNIGGAASEIPHPAAGVSRTPSELTAASKSGILKGKTRASDQDVPPDLIEAGEKPVDALPGGRDNSAASSGETLVTEDERARVPPFCELKKVVTPKGELIYVGWDGPDDPQNPRNVRIWMRLKLW